MKALVCTQCGGKINPATLRCEYCGTIFEQDRKTKYLRIVTTGSAVRLGAELQIGMCEAMTIPREDLLKITQERLAHELADALIPYINYTVDRSPMTMTVTVRGDVRVVPPDFVF